MVQGAGEPIHIDTHVGRLSSQVKLTPQSNIPKNLLERHPPQSQEHPGAKKNAREALTDIYEPMISV
jgi:endonuclease III